MRKDRYTKREPADNYELPRIVFPRQKVTGRDKNEPDREVIRETASPSTISLAGKNRDLKKSPAPAGPWMHRFSDQGLAIIPADPLITGEGIVKESLLGFFSCTGSCLALYWFGLLWLRYRYALFLCGFNHLLFQLPLPDGFWLHRVDRDDNETSAVVRFFLRDVRVDTDACAGIITPVTIWQRGVINIFNFV
jgi:hypothetical protein